MTAHPPLYFDAFRKTSSASSSSDRDGDKQPADDAAVSSLAAQREREHERSVHLRTQFLRRVAHDIASPAGVTTTVLDELAQLSAARPELATMAKRGIRRLLRLSELLALTADLEAGPIALETTLEDLRTLAKDAIDQAVLVDGRRDVNATLEKEDTTTDTSSEKIQALVDRRLLLLSLREMIGNALRFATKSVVVRVRLKSRDSALAEIVIEDDGNGIPPEVANTLGGERFMPRSTARGLGLSLSIAQDVIGAHEAGAALDVQANGSTLPVGRRGIAGALVTVTLPVVRRA